MEYEIENKKIGTLEIERLQPEKVKIISCKLIEVGKKDSIKKYKKISCFIQHSKVKDESIQIGSVKLLIGDKLKVCPLWYSLDKEENINKNSALAKLMNFLKAETIKELENKEIETVLDDRGYLVFKAY